MGLRKLTDADVVELRGLIAAGRPVSAVADAFGISQTHVRRLVARKAPVEGDRLTVEEADRLLEAACRRGVVAALSLWFQRHGEDVQGDPLADFLAGEG